MEDIHIVTPWNVEGNVNYQKLIDQFGTSIIDKPLIDKFEKIIKQPVHPLIKRGIFFTHRQLNNFLDAYDKGCHVYLYT